MLLPILITVTVFLLCLTIYGWRTQNEDAAGMGLGCLLVVAMLGWLMGGLLIPQKTTQTEIVARVLHDQNAVHLSVNNAIVRSYEDVATFNFLAEKQDVKVIKTVRFNMYGGSINNPEWDISNRQ